MPSGPRTLVAEPRKVDEALSRSTLDVGTDEIDAVGALAYVALDGPHRGRGVTSDRLEYLLRIPTTLHSDAHTGSERIVGD